MENSTRLLERHHDSLHSRHVLIVGADDRAQWQLPAASLDVHCDDASLAGGQAAMLPTVSLQTDLIVLVLPKSRDQLAFWLASLAGQINRETELWLLGPANGGVRGGVTELKRLGQAVQLVDSARHYKLFATQLLPAAFLLSDWQRCWESVGLTFCSYPGVFSHGRADAGTDLLLETLSGHPLPGTALDVGCGAGVISTWLAKRDIAVSAVDVSATAVASTQATLATNAIAGNVCCSDLYDQVTGRFDMVVTNPPFHDGTRRTLDITRRLIGGAPEHLLPGGSLWLVANQGLPYGDWLRETFSTVGIAAENRQFRVWHCQQAIRA